MVPKESKLVPKRRKKKVKTNFIDGKNQKWKVSYIYLTFYFRREKTKQSLLTLFYKYIMYNKIYKREILILIIRKEDEMKQPVKIYLDSETKKKLLQKVSETGFSGRGSLSKFIEKIAAEDICFLDENLRKMLKTLFPSNKIS